MKVLQKTLAVIALATVAGSAMAADEKVVTENGVATFSFFKPASVRAEVGTLGYGGAVSYNVTPKVGLTLGYNGGDISWTDDIKVDGQTYALDMDNNNVYLNAEIRPFGNWFYTALGVSYLDNEYSVNKHVAAGQTIKIGDTSFKADSNGASVTGQVSYDNKIAPYIGVGFSPAITNRWGMFGELGAYYTGNPNVSLSQTGTTTDAAAEAKIQEEIDKVRNEIKYEWLPVAKLGVTYRF